MTSVLSYPKSDPFASSVSGSDASSRQSRSTDHNPNPPYTQRPRTSTHHSSYSPQQPIPPPGMTSRTNVSPFAPPSVDEFGTRGNSVPTHHTTSSRPRTSAGPGMMPLAPPQPIASTSTAHASSHSHTATPANASSAAQRQRNRQSHNPSATLAGLNPAPPRAEYLSDEYVLHPSVYSYKQAHPRRPMVAFGPYVLLQTLGEGEFGKVKLGVHTEYGVEVAIKLIRRGSLEDEVRASKVEREIDVLKVCHLS
jgi:protein-serine/threonine kinase